MTFDSNGRPAMMHGAVVDTTARREAEEAQREIERQLMLLVEASSALLASPQSADVLRTITELAQRFVSADAYAVWRLHDDAVWRLRSSSGLSGEFVTSLEDSRSSHSLTAEPMVIEDCTRDARVKSRREVLEREGVRSMLVIPLRIQNRPSGTVVFYWKSAHNVREAEIRIASALGNLAASALGTAEIYERQLELRGEAEAAEKRATFLATAGAMLSSSLDYHETLSSVAELAIPVFADWASVDVLGAAGGLHRVAIAHKDPRKISLAREFAKRYPPREDDAAQVALRSGTSLLIEVVSDAMIAERARDPEHLSLLRELGLKSVIIAPMVFNGRSLGVITFVTAESERHYKSADLQTAEELARRAAAALENSRLYNESKQTQAELQVKNEDLRRANDDLNQFAYSASHDLQEPLRMVSIYSQLLKRKYAAQLDETADKYLSYAVEGASRMETLLRDILAYTQVANTDTVPPAPVAAGTVLHKALANLQGGISESGALIHTGELPAVRVQEVHLLQLFQNVIGNAIKYRKEQGLRIEIAASLECDRWLFSIADNGIGIDAQYKEQIFGLFKRLHSTEDYPGTGVGLAICQKIVERYRGRIWVDSEPGRGSTFYFTLPAGS